MSRVLSLARRGVGRVSPNPAVGAVIVRGGKELGAGWHRRAGGPHAEVAAIADAARRGNRTAGATIYVTLEPCSTHGRTPPCTEAIRQAGFRRVVVAATDPNPSHAGTGLDLLRNAGVRVDAGVLATRSEALNEAFNKWIVTGLPFVSVKAAMTLDGRIATADGSSKWITGPEAGRAAMRLRWRSDAILVGSETVLADDPSLTCRTAREGGGIRKSIRRVVLDTRARTPLAARVVADKHAADTVIVVGRGAPASRVKRLQARVNVWTAPLKGGHVSLRWVLRRLGREGVTDLLVEGGGAVNGAFLDEKLADRVVFFYAPLVLGGTRARRGIAGRGASRLQDLTALRDPKWKRVGADLMMTARIDGTD